MFIPGFSHSRASLFLINVCCFWLWRFGAAQRRTIPRGQIKWLACCAEAGFKRSSCEWPAQVSTKVSDCIVQRDST
eukprot:2107341-Amphidinium_carterae.1